MAKAKRSLVRNNQIELLILAGFLGFIIGGILLFGRDIVQKGKESVFHEVKYDPRHVLNELIKQERTLLQNATDSTSIATLRELDTLHNTMLVSSDSAFYKRINNQLVIHLDPSELDTLRFDSSMRSKQDTTRFAQTTPIHWIFRDTELLPADTLSGSIGLPITYFPSDVDFFVKYPGFAFWALFILSLLVTLFIVLAICRYITTDVKARVISCMPELRTKGNYLKHYFITLMILGAFTVVALLTYYDGSIVKDIYFLPGLRSKIIVLVAIGYLVTSFCFCGFIHSASYIDRMESIYTSTDETGKEQMAKCYAVLKSHFNTFFICTAILLSFLVFCTGSLYSAINEMEFIRKLKHDMGYSPVRQDFVYVYGGLHTLLILMFYIPVRLQFTSFEKEFKTVVSTDGAAQAQDKKLNTTLANPFKKMADVIIAGSPILVSFVQALLDALLTD
ncbi:MAG TPA: hypothetical protein VD993_05295 [Chitinophagaceae bacterium]|nr:hypothetical protein [Chitinophagaceae bacterium]